MTSRAWVTWMVPNRVRSGQPIYGIYTEVLSIYHSFSYYIPHQWVTIWFSHPQRQLGLQACSAIIFIGRLGGFILSWHGNIWFNHCAFLVPASPSITSRDWQITHALLFGAEPQNGSDAAHCRRRCCHLPRSNSDRAALAVFCSSGFCSEHGVLHELARAHFAHINKIEQNYV